MTLRSLTLGVFLAATTLCADTDARLQGLAKDDTGRPLPGVTADVHALTGSADRSAMTDSQGAFEIADLPPGRYQVAFRLPSFATTVRTVEVGAGTTVKVEATLRIALNADVLVTRKRTFRSLTGLDEPVNGLLGLAEASSTGVVTAQQIEERPVFRSAEVYEAVPGVVISQHSQPVLRPRLQHRSWNRPRDVGGGRAGQHAHARPRPGIFGQQLPHSRAGFGHPVPEGDLFRRGG
jgi:hypothetical protein